MFLPSREANSRHTYDVTIWLSRTTDNSNIFIRSREVRDNESRLYLDFILIMKRLGLRVVFNQLKKPYYTGIKLITVCTITSFLL